MEMFLYLFLCLGFCIYEGIAQAGNVTVCHNEEDYQECGSCERTCDNRNETCKTPCHPGCVCKPGLLRTRDRSCVQPKDCNRPSCKENEEYYECGSQCPLTCKNYQEPIFCTKQCTKGCFCKPGYVIGPGGKCILPTDCPVGPCRENELTTDCVNPCNTCSQRGKCYYEYCDKGCDCKPGFYKNSTGYCVPPNKCDVQESTCPRNEHYVSCVSMCNDCWSRGGDCEEHFCHPGCDCLPGFFRDDNEDCVPQSQCKTGGRYCGGANEEYSECTVPCNDCQSRGNCQYSCEYGCDCKKGYFRDAKGICIPASQCPGACHDNEEYLECGSACPETCNNRGQKVACAAYCVKGCFCKKGFIRGPDGRCVDPDKCPMGIEPRGCRTCGYKCPVGEEYFLCQPTCKKTCDTYYRQGATECPQECRPGCACKEGLVKNREGVCVYPQQCPQVCRDNEVYIECGSACPETCNTRGQNVSCAAYCVRGCFCKKGFVRGPDGRCVDPGKCPLVCGVNEEFLMCGSPCPLTCTNQTTSSICPKVCVQGCVCKPGYVRGPTGACILPRECPVVCSETEVFLECGSACQATCENTSKVSGNCILACRKGCFCKPEYVKGPDGKCILPQQCPVVCSENEVFLECGSACQATCENTGKVSGNCLLACRKGCLCKPEYVKGPDGKCILPQHCPVVCQEYEVFLECGPGCERTCDNTTIASCALPCRKGCFCQPGYIRGPTGKCILPQTCPIVCQENEVFLECGSACQGTCDSAGKAVGLCPKSCARGCFCKPGYIRGPYGKCILPQQCPIVCQENEVFVDCGSPCQDTCENIGKTVTRCPLTCIKGCFCKPGYIRGPNGKCILPNQCPLVCQGNEVLLSCGSPCQRTCDNMKQAVSPCTLLCIKGCFCKPGYVRGPTGFCILPTECPVVCGENEEFQKCGTACPDTCLNRTTSYACSLPCIERCFCKPGFVRGPDGKCILPTKCPVVCGENEEFQKCGTACPVTCFNLTTSYACTLPCIEGCFCKSGFVRGPDGKCILPTKCPVVCGENEEFQKCGTACPVTCFNLTTSYACTLPCIEGCFCKPGFVRGPDGKCILPTKCPVVCGENEEFQKCGTACPVTCFNLTTSYACTLPCIEGCFCKPGFVRGPDGKCILPTKCPVVCGENEEFQKCGTACPVSCLNLTTSYACTLPCIEGCFCKPGFVRGPDGKCILPTRCPVVCGENESFQKCGPACPITCSNRITTVACSLPCIEGCFCNPGYVRAPGGKCVLPRFCPVVCGENEQFFECRSPCQRTCENRNSVINCTYPCLTGCFCKPGFVRDVNGRCIDPRSCPTGPCTKENEIFNPCGPACIKTCARFEFRRQCPQRCVRGCFCKEGFVRDVFSNCILFENCPKEPQMCPTGESFYACKPTCRDTCETLDFQGPCDDLCRPGCACRGGFVRDTTNKCVPPRECPSMIAGRQRGSESDPTTTTLNPKIVTTKTLPMSKDEPKKTTKPIQTTIGITSKATTVDVGTRKPAITTTPSPVTKTSQKIITPTEAPKTKQPVTTLKTQLTTTKETVAPTVITTKTPGTTLKIPITTIPSPATKNPVTIGKTLQQGPSTASKPIETTSSKPVTTTPVKPVATTTVKPVVRTTTKPAETTVAKTVTVVTTTAKILQ